MLFLLLQRRKICEKGIMSFNTLFKYGYFRIAAVTPVISIADVGANTQTIKDTAARCIDQSCSLVLYPELSLTAYTCADLFFQKTLLNAVAVSLTDLAAFTKDKEAALVVGAPLVSNGILFNCAVFIANGEIMGVVPKTYLPNNNEYYEKRWFSSEFDRVSDTIIINGCEAPFGADLLFRLRHNPDCLIGIEICEDLWSVIPPSFYQARAGATLLLNLSAGNETLGKSGYRRQLVLSQSARCNAVYAYCSAGKGESTTDLVFPGHNMIAEYGSLLAESERFADGPQFCIAEVDIERVVTERIRNKTFADVPNEKYFRIIDFSASDQPAELNFRTYPSNPFVPDDKSTRTEVCSEIFSIQSAGLAKRLGFIGSDKVVLGISGGLDSTLALLVAVRTFDNMKLDRKGIIAVTMPGFGTTKRTRSNAEVLAKALGVTFLEIPISESVRQHFKDIGHSESLRDIVYENAQARERTQVLMDLANKHSAIVVGTGDLSELALGWCTYNGDHMSMYGVNAGIPKTLVKFIIEWFADNYHIIYKDSKKIPPAVKTLKDIIATPISPELLPAGKDGEIVQETEKSIGPYTLNDFFIYYSLRMNFTPNKIKLLADKVFKNVYKSDEINVNLINYYNRLFANQYKRSCMPDGIKVGTVSVSPRGDLRMPSDAEVNLWISELGEY